MEFSEWIVEELEKRGWSRSEAARRGGVSPSMFDKVINGYSKPGVKFIEGIAKAFKMSSAEVVMRMHQQKGADPWVEEMDLKLRRLSPGLRGIAERLINSMLEGEEAERRKNTKPKPRSAKA